MKKVILRNIKKTKKNFKYFFKTIKKYVSNCIFNVIM